MEKIRITADDIARADAAPPPMLAPPPQEIPIHSSPHTGNQVVIWVLGACGLAAFVVAVVIVFFFVRTRDLSVDEWIAKETKEMSAEIAQSSSMQALWKEIAPVLAFKGVTVKSMVVRTVDGSKRVGKHESNIAEVEFIIRVRLVNPMQEETYIQMHILWDKKANRAKMSPIDSTGVVMSAEGEWTQFSEGENPFSSKGTK